MKKYTHTSHTNERNKFKIIEARIDEKERKKRRVSI